MAKKKDIVGPQQTDDYLTRLEAAKPHASVLAQMVPDGSAYYSVRTSEGEQFFSTLAEAQAHARASGGLLIVHPTRHALRQLAMFASATAPDLGETTIQATQLSGGGDVVTVSNRFMSLSLVFTGGEVTAAIAMTAIQVSDRVVPGVGAASASEQKRTRPSHTIAMMAATRAINRAVADALGASILGAVRVEKREQPSVVLLRVAKELGLTPAEIREVAGKPLNQIGEDELDSLIERLRARKEQVPTEPSE